MAVRIVLHKVPDLGSSSLYDGMAFLLQQPFLRLNAARKFRVQFAVRLQRPPIGCWRMIPLVTGPCRNGHKNPCGNGLCKIRAVQFRKVLADAAYRDHFTIRNLPHDFIIVNRRRKIHSCAAVFFNRLRVCNRLDFRHILAVMQHSVEILFALVCHNCHLRVKYIRPFPPMQ